MAKPTDLDQAKTISTGQSTEDIREAAIEPFHGVDEIANRILDTKSIRHRTLLHHHATSPPTFDQGLELTRAISAKVEQNFTVILNQAKFTKSQENWRLVSPGTECAPKNRAREVGLERAMVAACQAQGRADWWNQVPVASGLIGGRAGRKRAIDLVHHRGCSAYDLVELKIGSDTPVYAAVEILEYGLLWLYSRQARMQLGYTEKNLLDADEIGLSVLAPHAFYGNADYQAFGEGIAAALGEIGGAHDVRFGFRFAHYPSDFLWTGEAENAYLCEILDTLYPGPG